MERWILRPLESVGKIRFGMRRDAVHELFDDRYKEFKKTIFSKNTSDDYKYFHVYYTEDDNVEAVEFFEKVEIELDGMVIFPIKTEEINRVLPNVKKEDDYYTDYDKSIGITANSEKAESILVAVSDYYA